jgi:phosphoribosylanthranilate isomerase
MLPEVAITRVKICCIMTIAEARMAIRHGASAVGLVSEMPSGPGVIPENRIAEIAATLPPAIGSFLLTSKQEASAIVAQQRRCAVNTVQICDRLEMGAYEQLRARMPGVSIVQVIHVIGEDEIRDAREVAPYVDGILLDTGSPFLPIKELGGTGRTHNWMISRRIREEIVVPVFLAGGLNSGNVAEAIRVVRPYAVDVCSGVRTAGKLDTVKLAAFFAAVRRA